jgi:hypothetical protein
MASGDSVQRGEVADARRLQGLARIKDPLAGIRVGERLNRRGDQGQVLASVEVRRAANRPHPDEPVVGQPGDVATAVGQRPLRAVRTCVLHSDIQDRGAADRDSIQVQMLGSCPEAEDLRAGDHGDHLLRLCGPSPRMVWWRSEGYFVGFRAGAALWHPGDGCQDDSL